MAGVMWKSTRLVRKLSPSTVHKPKVVVTAKTPPMKLKAPGIGARRLSRLAKMTAETTPAFSTLRESSNANPASASTRAATDWTGLESEPGGGDHACRLTTRRRCRTGDARPSPSGVGVGRAELGHLERPLVAGGLDGFVDVVDRLHALAMLVVLRVLEIVLRPFEMIDRVARVPCFLELDDGLVHFRLRGVRGAGGGGAAKREGGECDEEGLDVCFHDRVWV